MKNITKDNKGITLIALVVTITVMLLLVSVATYTGLDTYKHSKVNKFVIQMQLLQTKIDDLLASNTIQQLNSIPIESITTQEQINAIVNAFKQGEISTSDTSKYKVFAEEDLLNILNVEDIEEDIIVNFETREIISTLGIEYKGQKYYTQYKLPGGQNIINNTVEANRDLSFDLDISLDGLNATITIDNIKITNGTLDYKEVDSNYWTSITNYTEVGKKYAANISKTGNYVFKLQDNMNSEKYIEKTNRVTVTNKPKTENQLQEYNYALTSENWAYMQKDNIYYVWIPRFAYDTNNNIKFIKGNSNISTENTYIDDSWNIHSKFMTEDNIKLTGIWISVENTNQTGLNMMTLLNDKTRTTLTEI